ncbi:MAG: hypothetical protein PHW10_02110, partial [Candidatus Peribacteraceae bacterium]|nr:hypothetical protein [Candidatus Peribacteraceae bacterium]
LLGLALLIGSVVFDLREPLRHRYLLTVFLGVYVSYMIAIGTIDRVLYLYHYFTPLFLSFIILGLVFMELRRIGPWKLSLQAKTSALLVFAGLVFLAFEFYRPLSYYEPLKDEQFNRRALLPVWELTNVHTERVNSLAVPCR